MVQDESEIQSVVEKLIQNWNTHDPSCFAASFAEDAQFTDVLGQTVQGRGEIARLHVVPFTRLFVAAELAVEQAPVKFVTGEVASVNLHWSMQGHTSVQGEPLPPRRGVMQLVVVRRDGRWWPVVAHNSDHTATYTRS